MGNNEELSEKVKAILLSIKNLTRKELNELSKVDEVINELITNKLKEEVITNNKYLEDLIGKVCFIKSENYYKIFIPTEIIYSAYGIKWVIEKIYTVYQTYIIYMEKYKDDYRLDLHTKPLLCDELIYHKILYNYSLYKENMKKNSELVSSLFSSLKNVEL